MNDDTEVVSPAESEILMETSDTSKVENTGSVSVENDQLVIHPEEESTVEVNDNEPFEANADMGYVTTRIPSFIPEGPEPDPEPVLEMKYQENVFLQETLDYIISTYGQHYVNQNDAKRIQVFDFWESLGSLDTTARDTAIKYIARYGKKGGYNKKDLMKAIHYIVILAHTTKEQMV